MPPTRSAVVQMERSLDYYYDPDYTVSGVPRAVYRLAQGPAVPAAALVSGSNRYKYFKAPVVPSWSTVPPEVLLSIEPPPKDPPQRPPSPPTRNVATQSDYRDQDVQTDPFTPDYVVPAGTEPEVLTLASLTWARGLPASLAEVELIDRARERRLFEARLPDITEDAQLWRSMMEEQQLREMKTREEEIERMQADRLELIRLALEKSNAETQYVNYQRIEALREHWMAKRDRQLNKLQMLRIKAIRKLSKARKASLQSREPRKRDIIAQYADFGSKVYAPMTRQGLRIDMDSYQYETAYVDNLKLDDILDIEASLPARMTRTHIAKPRVTKYSSASGARKAAQMVAHLNKMEEVLLKSKGKKKAQQDDDLAAYRKAPVVVRPPTPELDFQADDDATRCAAVFLQRLVRGRAMQSQMFQGKERRLELIRELRTVETLEDERVVQRREHMEALQMHKEELLQGHLGHGIGTIVGRTLDYLSKELVRYKEERRLNALVLVAERTRRMREAEESGKREKELQRRERQDEVFRQIMKVHSGTVDTYLEQVVAETISTVSREQAMREAKQKAEYVNAIVDSLEDAANDPGEIVKDLVSSFLLPGVMREDVKAKVSADQKKFVLAAHKTIYEQTGGKVISMAKEAAALEAEGGGAAAAAEPAQA
mmetsp:Transcript_28786/g.66479  ORF Transcript_28786/g.66479 Transcript_28786/m.66479 type:complete len:657 (-) Transcript_28786:93-2063(-)|eukprot:CAMPEP_0114553100 /NCGR_PEP_ID=MMETSP0114-20121206/7476_1 /TAXON_ID=31324 /ORGANISM="Goniomonas sp, Strain m" /LENGTH=656 /DNA_ID=CAMNT_0001738017 /DNA_START=55 /DNA_END=2025 /DNA_ORIENTATION=-